MDDYIEKIQFNFPKNRDEYLMKILGYVFLGFIIVFIANKIFINFAIFVLLIVFIVLSEKIYMFMTVDEVVLDKNYFYVLYKKNIKHKIPITSLGVKITHDINGVSEISFYDYFKKKKIFSFKQNEIDENSFSKMIQFFKNYFIDKNIFKDGTYGEMILLSSTSLDETNDFNYVIKKSFYSSYGWMIVVMVIVIIILTLTYAK